MSLDKMRGLRKIPITKEQEADIRKGISMYDFQEKYPQTALKWYMIAGSHIKNEKEPDPILRMTLNNYMDSLLDGDVMKEAQAIVRKALKVAAPDADYKYDDEIAEENKPTKKEN